MATDPLFTATFDHTSSDDYGAFISGIRDRLGNPRHISHNRPVLPPVESGIPPRLFHAVLKTRTSTLTLATRADNLDLAGFRSGDGTWWELNHGRKRWLVCGPRGLIPGASFLRFGSTYRDLTGGAIAIEFAMGRKQMKKAIHDLAAHTEAEKQKQQRQAMGALVVLRYMVHEAIRFLDVSSAVAGLMCSPGTATKRIRLQLNGSVDDLGWKRSSSLLLSADSLSGRPGRASMQFVTEGMADWEKKDWLDKAVAKVGIVLFVATEYGIKPKPALRLFNGDLCLRTGTDEAAVEAEVDVTFLVSGESVAAHRYILAGKSIVFLRQFFYCSEEKKSPCVEVKDMRASVFKAMIHFIYTDKVPKFDYEQPNEEALAAFSLNLLEAAHRYELDRLKLICIRKLQSGAIYASMAATALTLAEKHNYPRLKAMCIDFIVSTHETLHCVLTTEGYKHLEASYPSLLTELLKSVRVHGKGKSRDR